MQTAGGTERPLKPLSRDYVKRRARDSKLSADTGPETSNLTQYGSMLDSLTYSLQQGKLTVTVTGADNVKKAIYTSVDRPWVNLTLTDIIEIQKVIKDMLADL